MTETKPLPKKFKIIPNTDRIIIQYLDISAQLKSTSLVLIPGQLKAGENLLAGIVVEMGKSTKYQKGQIVYYSEYSASQLTDIGDLLRGRGQLSDMKKQENQFIVIAEDDIVAMEDGVDPDLIVQKKENPWDKRPAAESIIATK